MKPSQKLLDKFHLNSSILTPNMTDTKSTNPLTQLDETLELYLVKKAPYTLPDNIKELIVTYSPWVSLVLGIVLLPVVMGLLGMGAILSPFAYLGGSRFGSLYMMSMIVSLVELVLYFVAIPSLLKRSMSGWRLVFYSTLLGAVSSLLGYNVLGAIVGTLISLYVLYQIKSYYK